MFCAFGISLSFHYCSGNLKRISLVTDPFDKGCCNTMKKHKCCHDKIVKAEKQDHRAISKYILKLVSFHLGERVPGCLAKTTIPVYKIALINFHLRPPPLKGGKAPLYILNSVFRV
jgi:hypothetical protein